MRPPQIMSVTAASSLDRSKLWQRERPFWKQSAASRMAVASTRPPPMVPWMRPSLWTTIRAPATRGVEPDWLHTVARTRSSPLSRVVHSCSMSFFMNEGPPDGLRVFVWQVG